MRMDEHTEFAGEALAAPKIYINSDAYLAAFLHFQNALPMALSSSLPAPLYDAVAFWLTHPTPVADYAYMAAYVDIRDMDKIAHNLSLTAIGQIAPDVSAWASNALANDWSSVEAGIVLVGNSDLWML